MRPNILVYIDFASDDPEATGEFYAQVMRWEHERRMPNVYHRLLPGGSFPNKDGTDSGIEHLHMGIFKAGNQRPHPDPRGAEPRHLADFGRKARIWVEVSPDDTHDRIVATAERLGATILWRNHIFTTFGGLTDAFRDPWGNEVAIWTEGDKIKQVSPQWTRE